MLPDGITVYSKIENSFFTNKEFIHKMIREMRKRGIVKYDLSLFEKVRDEYYKDLKLLAGVCCEQFIEAWKLEFNDNTISNGQLDLLLRKYFT